MMQMEKPQVASSNRANCPNKHRADYKLIDCYNDYLKFIEPDSRYKVDWNTYKLIYSKVIAKELYGVLEEGRTMHLDGGMGDLRIIKRAMTFANPRVDWKATMELNQTVYHTNLHTRGFYIKFQWNKRMSSNKNKRFYAFVPNRDVKRRASKLFKEGTADYFAVSTYIHTK